MLGLDMLCPKTLLFLLVPHSLEEFMEVPLSQIGVIPMRVTGVSDIFHHPVFYEIEDATFRKLDLFLSSGVEGGNNYSVGALRPS
jgi:hypothetical protein